MKITSPIIASIIVITLAWASLFVTVLNQSQRTHQLLQDDQVLLKQDTNILNAQKKTQSDLENKIDDLQRHVDCLFNLATQPSPANSHIANAVDCTITTSPSPSSTSISSSPPVTTPAQQTGSSQDNSGSPAKKNVIQKLLDKL
jgi:hypothetical protein